VKLYLDADISYRIAEQLRLKGYDCSSAQEQGAHHLKDEEQLAWAAEDRRCIVTYNRDDFIELVARWFETGREHSGVLIISSRIPKQDFRTIIRRLSDYLDAHSEDDFLANGLDFISRGD
jgi:predicted nuclease of predicted toxin-antitoxin system